MLVVKASTAITLLFKNLKLIAGGSVSLSFLKEAKVLAHKLAKVRQQQGIKGLTSYLKSCSVVLQQALAGYRIPDMTLVGPRVSRTTGGLPRIICRSHRLIIRDRKPGCYFLMKYYLSVFYIYRVLEFPGKLKLETITNPGKYLDMNHYESYMDHFIRVFIFKTNKDLRLIKPIIWLQRLCKVFPIFRSSPFTNSMVYFPFKEVKSKNKSTSSQRQL